MAAINPYWLATDCGEQSGATHRSAFSQRRSVISGCAAAAAALLLSLVPTAAWSAPTVHSGRKVAPEIHKENFDDWQVACGTLNAAHFCAVIQERAATREGSEHSQRLFAIELKPGDDGVVGTLILPFGLDLAKGVTLKLANGPSGPAQPFRTCIPSGCVVQLQFGEEALKVMRASATLELGVIPLAGDGTGQTIPVSLKGFGAALDRARHLAL